MEALTSLVAEYNSALTTGAGLAPVSEQALYGLHVERLMTLTKLLSSSATSEEIGLQIAADRRAYGWSYLSGAESDRVERAFSKLEIA